MAKNKRLLETLIDLVKIDSLSYEERSVADYILGTFHAMGVECYEDDAGSKIGGNCGNVIVRIPGAATGPSIMLAAHMDTVEPGRGVIPEIRNDCVCSRGHTVLGADDKSGVAVILEVIRTLVENGTDYPILTAVFTVGEEKGLLGVAALDFKVLDADLGFILDEGGPIGRIVVKAPYQDYFSCEFTGVAAHAGVEPEKGKSAVQTAAKAIDKMSLGRLDDETTANIGVIKAGTAINIVPAHAVIEGEARSHSLEKLHAQIEHMKQACVTAGFATGVKETFSIKRLYDGFDLPASHAAVARAVKAVESIGKQPKTAMSGGGSDTNFFNKHGIPSVNVSVGYERVHTIEERQPISALNEAFDITMALVLEGGTGK